MSKRTIYLDDTTLSIYNQCDGRRDGPGKSAFVRRALMLAILQIKKHGWDALPEDPKGRDAAVDLPSLEMGESDVEHGQGDGGDHVGDGLPSVPDVEADRGMESPPSASGRDDAAGAAGGDGEGPGEAGDDRHRGGAVSQAISKILGGD